MLVGSNCHPDSLNDALFKRTLNKTILMPFAEIKATGTNWHKKSNISVTSTYNYILALIVLLGCISQLFYNKIPLSAYFANFMG
ncbi:MAG: hypothetical protein EAZ41_00645 [Sphingobacteriia bacterium]|nr:MAG: hypothetical protein EAZ41_00645 [Sphingobacteriia bacterium]